jgi:Icc protein
MASLMRREYRILQLSDTHVGANGVDEDGVDAVAALDCLLASVARVPDIDLILVTGDVADDGSEHGCVMVRDAIGHVARRAAIPQIYTTGNHDRRPGFSAALGNGHLTPDGGDAALSAFDGEERAAVSMIGDLRVVTLDSLVPGETHGVISEAQLTWLAEVLDDRAPDGTVLAFHHPPVHLPRHPMGRVVLQNIEELAAVVQGSDVVAILTGHLHLQLSARLAGIAVWVTPGVVTRIDLTSPPHLVRGVLGAAATVIDIGGPFSPIFTVVHARDPRAGELVYLYDTNSGAEVPDEDA